MYYDPPNTLHQLYISSVHIFKLQIFPAWGICSCGMLRSVA